ncbi:S9 family peptidase [Pseudenhygromyxa sp. WMMC2535]|uniref:dipeptidyl-peptidase 5 n=1 Tax=Pseudenhygromyxa sp. WMMC2535 TaxID=2712867 RepID=UPI0015525832|nr:S9 family peptidase [Pseudenhygromyxa sp. WMMC2535]NVB39358.1 S9 family peptidase [Pseudenhygromyxa sp. WMMC2535]
MRIIRFGSSLSFFLGLSSLAALVACADQGDSASKGDKDKAGEAEAPSDGQGIEPIPGLEAKGADDEGDAPVELAAIAPAGEHAFSILDMLEVDRVSSPAPSPDGSLVAYVLRETDMAANRGRTSLWVVGFDGAAPRRLDAHPKGLSQPSWSPDGKFIYFLSSRSGDSQVWRLPMAEGAAAGPPEQVSKLPVPVTNLALGPKGATMAMSAELFVDCPDLACTAEREAARAADPSTGVVYERMFVRHWDTWKDGRRSMLLTADVGLGVEDARIVSRGLDADVPSKPFGGFEELTFTPDGSGLIFAARDAKGGGGEPWSTNFDLFHAPVDGAAVPNRLTQNPAWDTAPQFSPDGTQLAWLAMARPGFEADRFVLMVQPWGDNGLEGEPRAVTEAWDRSVAEYVFTPDGRSVLATAQHLGQKPLFSVDLATGETALRVSEGTVSSPGIAGERLTWLVHDLRHPTEIHVGTIAGEAGGGQADAQLTHTNDELMARVSMGRPEQFSFEGAGGDRVYGWMVEPTNFDPNERYPVAFLIHGGPQGSFGNMFHFRWNAQAYAGAGYAVVMIDFHGSTGYGQAFTDAIRGDWGGKPLEDLRAGLDHALEAYPWMDADRVCALGASYGGFMINWIAGNWPDRFRCLVNHDGIFDQRMMYYATEELWFPEWEQGGPEFENPKGYSRFNPVDHVNEWRTPMMVIHGSLDYRVPVEQGLATFTALQRRGIESRFLHFPDENHWVLSPANAKLWHDEVLGWLESKLQAGTPESGDGN